MFSGKRKAAARNVMDGTAALAYASFITTGEMHMETTTMTIPAMRNEAIAIAVAKALESVAGVDSVHITLAHASARVGFNEVLAAPRDLRAAVETAGFVVGDAPARSCCGGCGG
jgi:copper chaperone CopZ